MTVVCVDDHSVMLKGIKQSVKQILPDASVGALLMRMRRLLLQMKMAAMS
jgi:hypothetical protein